MDWTGGFLHDIRYAARLARRQPRHALLTIGMTALGIGATTALFSVAYGVLWEPLAWAHAQRVVVLLLRGVQTRFQYLEPDWKPVLEKDKKEEVAKVSEKPAAASTGSSNGDAPKENKE